MQIEKKNTKILDSWVVKLGNTSDVVLRRQYTLCHHTDRSPMGLGQYNSYGEYCGPHTAYSVFLILFSPPPFFKELKQTNKESTHTQRKRKKEKELKNKQDKSNRKTHIPPETAFAKKRRTRTTCPTLLIFYRF